MIATSICQITINPLSTGSEILAQELGIENGTYLVVQVEEGWRDEDACQLTDALQHRDEGFDY